MSLTNFSHLHRNSQQQRTRGCRPQRLQRRARSRRTSREALRARQERWQKGRQKLGLQQAVITALLHISRQPRHAKCQTYVFRCALRSCNETEPKQYSIKVDTIYRK